MPDKPAGLEETPLTLGGLVKIIGWSATLLFAGWGARNTIPSEDFKALEAKASIAAELVKLRETEIAMLRQQLAFMESKLKAAGILGHWKFEGIVPALLSGGGVWDRDYHAWDRASNQSEGRRLEHNFYAQKKELERMLKKYQQQGTIQVQRAAPQPPATGAIESPPPTPDAILFRDGTQALIPVNPDCILPTPSASPAPATTSTTVPAQAPAPYDAPRSRLPPSKLLPKP